MNDLKMDVKCKVYKDMAHGFMNMHVTGCGIIIKNIVRQSVTYLNHLFKS